MIKYIGSKRLLIPKILELVRGLEDVRSVCDLFSGTSRVGHALKREGYFVHANDLMSYANTIAQALIASDKDSFPFEDYTKAIQRLNEYPGKPGYFTERYAIQARYFQPHNAERIDAIREAIDDEPEELRPALLTSLMLAADRVDSTVGVQMAFLKAWSARSFQEMQLVPVDMLSGPGLATQRDAIELAAELDADLAYLDPPYNQHSYLGNYHVWETLVLNDHPETYGTANKREDCRTRQSPFNRKSEAKLALDEVLRSLKTRYLILSFNDEGYISGQELEEMLARWGDFECLAVPHRRHIGSSIGIYNLKGEKVGNVGHTRNHEFLFVAKRRR